MGEETSAILRVAHEQASEITRRAETQADRCVQDAAANAVSMTEDAKRKLRQLDGETDAVWAERGRLIEDVRSVATALFSLAEDAADRFPEEGDRRGPAETAPPMRAAAAAPAAAPPAMPATPTASPHANTAAGPAPRPPANTGAPAARPGPMPNYGVVHAACRPPRHRRRRRFSGPVGLTRTARPPTWPRAEGPRPGPRRALPARGRGRAPAHA